MNDEALVTAHQRGFIPGDGETEEMFLSRIHRHQAVGSYLLFDMQVDWVPIEVGKDVRFWEGGYTEIELKGARIVLPKKPSRLLSMKELLQHELVHAVRCGFTSSKYEELIAYQLSARSYRKMLGPIFENRVTAWICLGISALSAFVSPLASLGFVIPFLTFLPKRNQFYRAFKKIEQLFNADPRAIILHLSDDEIDFFAKNSIESALHFIRENNTPRIRQLRLCYKNYCV